MSQAHPHWLWRGETIQIILQTNHLCQAPTLRTPPPCRETILSPGGQCCKIAIGLAAPSSRAQSLLRWSSPLLLILTVMRVLHQGRNLNCIKIPPPNFDLGSEASLTIKGKWEQDALQPGIRLFLESHPQKVADLGSDFGLVRLQNTLA